MVIPAVRKAVIPAAGFGTRFLPATKAQPKEMLTVVDKPMIQYSVEETVGSGIKKIGIIIGRGKEAVTGHFDTDPELEDFLTRKGKTVFLKMVKGLAGMAEISAIRQPQAQGLGHAVSMAENYIGNEPFAVLLPDNIYDCPVPCIRQLLDVHEKYQTTVIVLERIGREETKRSGVIKAKQVSERLFQVEDLEEKPGPGKAMSDLGVVGRYIFSPRIFQAIRKTRPDRSGEVQITDAVRHLLAHEPVYGYLYEGTRYDAGDKWGFLQATLAMAMKRKEFQGCLLEWAESAVRRFCD
ncbi:MAG: UTP--glucose-1-phosphate uridylyltransferase [Candidatus Aminicenantes bacterium]